MICLSASSRIFFLFYGLAITCLTSATVSASYGGNETDYLALLSFKSKITHDPNKVLVSWNHSFHFCEWSGISCGKRHKQVTVLRLKSQGLEGSLSPHVGNLSFLRKLSLSNNSFQGTIPRELGRLYRLHGLYLNENKFSGVIPTNLSRCSNIEDIWLSENMLTGRVPKDMSLLSKLANLVIEDNNLTGGIPPFLAWPADRVLLLERNEENFTRASEINETALFLRQYHINGSVLCSRNPLGGNIPDTFGLWKSLMGYGCEGCNLHGSIPLFIFNRSLLAIFTIPGNHLTGTLPSTIGVTLPNLELLQLWGNKLTGVLPASISNYSRLRFLEMSYNKLSGKLTIDFSKLRDINRIILNDNNSHGREDADDMRFVDSLKNCTRLRTLDFSNCSLVGRLPISIGPIPDAIGNLSLLTELYLHSNILEGHIPSSLGNCKELNGLNLHDNRLSGIIPPSLSSLGGLEECFPTQVNFRFLENNKLCGGLVTLKLPKRKEKGSKKKRFLKVSYNELLKATDGFSTENLIGEGGFSSVYNGILDSDVDKFVAVKVLHLQNRGAHKSFLAECEAWRNIRHRNLLKVITSCSSTDFQGNDFKVVVDQFISNGKMLQPRLIIFTIATKKTIVHGDLKPSNILLDGDMVAHVGDFGLARLVGTDLNQNSSTGIKGTIGYAPTEYGLGSEMSSIGDVYSFGILLLELMTGKKPTDGMFNEGLSLHKFACMALPDHVIDVIDNDAIVLQSTEANAKKVEECLAAIIKIGVSCSLDFPPQRMQIEMVLIEYASKYMRYNTKAGIVKLNVTATRSSACGRLINVMLWVWFNFLVA
nr:protein kinase-like domain-containing protein [Tanacetum cinerariifolium]